MLVFPPNVFLFRKVTLIVWFATILCRFFLLASYAQLWFFFDVARIWVLYLELRTGLRFIVVEKLCLSALVKFLSRPFIPIFYRFYLACVYLPQHVLRLFACNPLFCPINFVLATVSSHLLGHLNRFKSAVWFERAIRNICLPTETLVDLIGDSIRLLSERGEFTCLSTLIGNRYSLALRCSPSVHKVGLFSLP